MGADSVEAGLLDRQITALVIECINSGRKLPTEQEMMDRFGVSRFALREALSTYEANGIIKSVQGSGRYAQFPDLGVQIKNVWSVFIQSSPTVLLELLEIRKILELSTLPTAVDKLSAEGLLKMHKEVLRMQEKAREGQPFPQHDREFHLILYQAVGNKILTQLIAAFWDLYETAEVVPHEDDPEAVARQHYEIMEAVAGHDVERATKLLEDQFIDSRNKLSLALIKREEPQADA